MSLEKPTCFTRLMVRLGGLIGSRYHTTNFGTIIRHWWLLLAALSRAFWIAGSGVNPPHVIHSWVKKTAGSPDPHPMSRTDPVISPLRTSSVNSLRGRPISQGGCPYMPSQRNPYLTKASARIITISSRHQGTTLRPHLRFVS